MTAEELLAAAGRCLHCGREHERRIARDHRGGEFVTRTDPGDGHMPRPLDDAYLAALKRIADAAERHAPATATPPEGDGTPEPAATRTAPRSRKPRSR